MPAVDKMVKVVPRDVADKAAPAVKHCLFVAGVTY